MRLGPMKVKHEGKLDRNETSCSDGCADSGTVHWSEGSQVQRVTGLGFRVRVMDRVRVMVSTCCDCLTESPLTSIM